MHFLAMLLTLLIAPLTPIGPHNMVTPSDAGPAMQNPGFEWNSGYHEQAGFRGLVPDGWTGVVLGGDPLISSTDHWAKEGCGPNAFVERLEGDDSLVFLAAPTRCGDGFVAPPFDAAVYQRVKVEPGQAYSLSAWMVSLCGGSGNPNTCPAGYYMSKMTGLDATGGTNPLDPSIHWTEDRRPHIESRWANLIDATTAQTSTLTVYIRVNSPFQHEGNHAFSDAVKLVRSPESTFVDVGAVGDHIAVSWTGNLGPDIPEIPATNHKLSFELQVRRDDGPWQPWLSGQAAGEANLALSPSCISSSYQFRIRAWAIQPDGQPGAWPNHHFVGAWHESSRVPVNPAALCLKHFFLPAGQR